MNGSGKGAVLAEPERDITQDFLLCNRCGTCRSICPLYPVYREEWASARGKVELAEAFFRGEKVDDKKLQKIFDLCLHCMMCEENCPSGMRADEIVMAVRAELARRGLIPRLKRIALMALEEMDNALFKLMRAIGLVRRAPLHGIGGRSPLSFLFPLLGWPRERFFPLPKDSPFLSSGQELFRARDMEVIFPDLETLKRGEGLPEGPFDPVKASDLIELVLRARKRNIADGKCAYYFVGHTVNHFFPEESEAVVWVLNLLGVDVLAPKDQVCCGAPVYYAGDIEGARKAAATALERFTGHRYDWLVTSCSSGGLMLKGEFPRLFDLTSDGYFKIAWDPDMDTFHRVPEPSRIRREYPRAADLYREYVEGKVFDINELLVELLGLHEAGKGFQFVFEGDRTTGVRGSSVEEAQAERSNEDTVKRIDLPVVTYHHPCHLKRGQGVEWQPEIILKKLPGYRYVRMQDADRCCGGGGSFTFLNSQAAEEVAGKKMDAVAALRPDVLATACPICRIQLMDMLQRRFVLASKKEGGPPRYIPVKTPIELLCEDLAPILRVEFLDDRRRSG